MASPFSDAHLRLKQVDISAVSELGRSLFTAVLGSYGFTYTEDQIAEGREKMGRLLGVPEVEFQWGGRRFAGDRTLPRTRYFSVTDAAGMDERTLLQEMSAYLHGCTYPGLITLFDSDGLQTMELAGILADIPKINYQALDFTRLSLLMAIRPLAPDPALIEAYGEGTQYVVQVPYQLCERTVERVIDLREPAARAWLVTQFGGNIRRGDKDFPLLLGGERPDSFEQILPSLLDQWLGGGWTTGNMAGFFARQSGASGLVYPSARTNACVEVRDGVVARSSGWCYVSYEEAPPMEMGGQVSVALDPWPAQIGWSAQNVGPQHEFIPLKGTRIDYIRSGPLVESFAVRELAEHNLALYRLAQLGPVFRFIDQELGSDVHSRLSNLALYSVADDILWICMVLRNSLLGDAQCIIALQSRISAAGHDYERETYTHAHQLITRVTPDFRATGPLATALGFS